jgi:hypothetical protein
MSLHSQNVKNFYLNSNINPANVKFVYQARQHFALKRQALRWRGWNK